MSRRIFLAFIFLSYSFILLSQADSDPVLFTVGKTPVHVSEFQYIYSKTNGTKADFSEKSLREYLDLYSKFKLKVERARDMKLDTIQSLKRELAGYRRQLSKNYLMDREVMEKLLREAYERKKKDVSISHILVKVPNDATFLQVQAARNKLLKIKKQLTAGKGFAELAREYSEDGSSKETGGKIGYITTLQLPGFYEIETAAYNTPVGEVSEPIRSRLGFHLIRVDETRTARGELEIAHILVRVSDKAKEEAKAQGVINRIYRELQDGKNFETLAKTHSSDEQTKRRGGYIGFMGIGEYESVFEEAAFGISKDGGFSRPFRSSIGWHVVKRIKHKPLLPYEEMKGSLQNQIRRDSRFQIVQNELVNRIKKEADFQEFEKARVSFFEQLDQSFLTYQWKEPNIGQDITLFALNKKETTLKQFIQYLKQNTGTRVREGRSTGATPKKVAQKLLNQYIQQECLAYEEGQLETKYPEFKSLMREYSEGILLFEVTKRLVWDKASQDTIGLAAYYENNKNKYQWSERADATIYTLKSNDPKVIKKFLKTAKRKSPEKVLKKINKKGEVLSFERNTYERGKNKMVDAIVWKKGMVGSPFKEEEATKYAKIEKVVPPKPKSLKEARGYVVADYQDYLEKTWVEELNRNYELKINEQVFQGLIKK